MPLFFKRDSRKAGCKILILMKKGGTRKQTTWFTKGLRLKKITCFSQRFCRNKRPDLRRDCDCKHVFSCHLCLHWNKRPDLRRDCDKLPLHTHIRFDVKQTTWFTKGLRLFLPQYVLSLIIQRNKRPDLRRDCDPLCFTFFLVSLLGNKRPDLRRDCDARADSLAIVNVFRETNDLIYEGIATLSQKPIVKSLHRRNKRPDLRRDCDSFLGYSNSFSMLSKQTTWFTKGLRLSLMLRFVSLLMETNDLIYEGIATTGKTLRSVCMYMKQTTWFTKGLRRRQGVPN